MDDKVTYIKTEKDFKDAWTLLNNVFQIDQRMPNQVFKEPFGCFIFEEFDWAMTPEFWNSVIRPLLKLIFQLKIVKSRDKVKT